MRYVGYKIQVGDQVHSDYLNVILNRKRTYPSFWIVTTAIIYGWDYPICSYKLYHSQLFQELLK